MQISYMGYIAEVEIYNNGNAHRGMSYIIPGLPLDGGPYYCAETMDAIKGFKQHIIEYMEKCHKEGNLMQPQDLDCLSTEIKCLEL